MGYDLHMNRKHKEQRVGVFVDVQNMYYSAKNLYSAKVDFGKILKDSVGDRKLVRAFAYVIKADVGAEKEFFDALAIKQFADEEKFDLKKILYVGNDVNDYNAMKLCGYTACPSDSHEIIKLNSTIVLNSKGGCGVAREIVEEVFRIDFNKILYAE